VNVTTGRSSRSGEERTIEIRGAALLSDSALARDNAPKLSIGKLLLQDISWLLLQSAQHAGSGVLSTVDYIQGLHPWRRGPNGGACDPAGDEPSGALHLRIQVLLRGQ
jgi:hypothetical protein